MLPDFGLAIAFLATWISPHNLGPRWTFGDAFVLVFMDCVVISLGLAMIRFLSPNMFGRRTARMRPEMRRAVAASNESRAFYLFLIPYALGALLCGAVVTGSLWPFGAFVLLAWRKRRGLALDKVSNKVELDEAAIRELAIPAGYWCCLVLVILLAAFVGVVPDFALSPEAVSELFPDLTDDGGATPKIIAFGFLYYLGWGVLNAWAVLSPGRNPLSSLNRAIAEESREEFAADYLIDLNRASPELLDTLPGIGPGLAADIVRYRTATPFQTVGDLTEVDGIGPKIIESIRYQVKVDSED